MRGAAIICSSVLFAGAGAFAQTPEAIAKVEYDLAMKRLQGVWIPDSLITADGLQVYPVKGRALVFSQNEFARLDGNKVVQGGKFALFPADPGVIDFNITDRDDWDLERATATPDKPLKKQKAVFKIDGDVLTVAYPVPGRNRPDDLRAAPHRQVVVYKRQVEKVVEPKVDKKDGETLKK